MAAAATSSSSFIGLGLYSPREASTLLGIPTSKIYRWLRGHKLSGTQYEPLWEPQVTMADGGLFLGFRDLMEVRVASAFIEHGISPQKVRAAITLAREILDVERPLSTDRFRTDGRNIFLRVRSGSGERGEAMIDLFRHQYVFSAIIEPSLKGIEFDADGTPYQWWPNGQKGQVVLDPSRSFGQPIDAVSSVPTAVLASAAKVNGIPDAARSFRVSTSSIRRALAFERQIDFKRAA